MSVNPMVAMVKPAAVAWMSEVTDDLEEKGRGRNANVMHGTYMLIRTMSRNHRGYGDCVVSALCDRKRPGKA